jgi:methionyl-tRNA formyltransferase
MHVLETPIADDETYGELWNAGRARRAGARSGAGAPRLGRRATRRRRTTRRATYAPKTERAQPASTGPAADDVARAVRPTIRARARSACCTARRQAVRGASGAGRGAPRRVAGEVVALGADGIVVKCGEDAVARVARAARRPRAPLAADWANGRGLEIGDLFAAATAAGPGGG